MRWLVLAILALSIQTTLGAPRDPVKCGHIIAARIEQAAHKGINQVVKLPNACPTVTFQTPYKIKPTPGGPELWRDNVKLAKFITPKARQRRHSHD